MSMLRLRSDEVVWSRVGEEIVMLELASSSYFTVRGCGTAIIERLAEGATEEALVQDVTSRFEIDIQTAKSDIEHFLKELTNKNMLTTDE